MDNGAQLGFSNTASGNVDVDNKRIMCRKEDFVSGVRKYDGRWWEYQANRAIGGFLLPKALVSQVVEPLLSPVGSLGMTTLTSERFFDAKTVVANVFDVNPVVAEIRLKEMYPTGGQGEL